MSYAGTHQGQHPREGTVFLLTKSRCDKKKKARIKRIMQADEEVGKVSLVTPFLVV